MRHQGAATEGPGGSTGGEEPHLEGGERGRSGHLPRVLILLGLHTANNLLDPVRLSTPGHRVVPRMWDLQEPCSTVPPSGGGGKRAGLQHMAPDTRASYGPKGYRTVLLYKWSSVLV